MKAFLERFRSLLIGRRLQAAMVRNNEAADMLDMALRKVLER